MDRGCLPFIYPRRQMKDKQPLEYTNIVYTTKLYHQVGVVGCEEFIPVSLEAAALLAALTHPNHLVSLSSWG